LPNAAIASETVLERLTRLHPKLIDLSLGRVLRLLDALGRPQDRLPPALHVAGTNGKGSTCAFLRAIAEAAGMRAHVYTSPHLVRFHERIRLAGALVSEEQLYETLLEVERVNDGAPITFFEITTACALLLFSRVPADVTILEVGLGGRLDTTNVVARPAATAVTAIGFDHMDWLGDTLTKIAREKCGIFREGVPAITGAQEDEARAAIITAASEIGATLLMRGRDWDVVARDGGLRWEGVGGTFDLPAPSLPGPHQVDNAGVAVATILASGVLSRPHPVPLPPKRGRGDRPRMVPQRPLSRAWAGEGQGEGLATALALGLSRAEWPARLQRLQCGPLVALLPPGWELWLDGGHNPAAGEALAAHAANAWSDRPLYAVVGMKTGKGVDGFLAALMPCCAALWAVAEPDQHLAMQVEQIVAASGGAARIGPTLAEAVAQAAREAGPARVLVCGSLYLAGLVLGRHG
jgi:dihydrofolate synthase/folylpolyglutamate synthase